MIQLAAQCCVRFVGRNFASAAHILASWLLRGGRFTYCENRTGDRDDSRNAHSDLEEDA